MPWARRNPKGNARSGICISPFDFAFIPSLMPELPEVEVLVSHLRPLLREKSIRHVEVHRARVLRPTAPMEFKRKLRKAVFTKLSRRGKYLLFTLREVRSGKPVRLLGHLGMTGRMYLQP